MSKMSEMETVVTELRTAAANINDIADTLYKMFGGQKAAEPETKLPTLEEVRAVLAEKSRQGHTAEVRALLQKYGADKLSEISQEHYPALLKDAEVLANAD